MKFLPNALEVRFQSMMPRSPSSLTPPESPALHRLLDYEASLERAFDRTLSQLERLQRMRLGQAVPPQIDVNVSSS